MKTPRRGLCKPRRGVCFIRFIRILQSFFFARNPLRCRRTVRGEAATGDKTAEADCHSRACFRTAFSAAPRSPKSRPRQF